MSTELKTLPPAPVERGGAFFSLANFEAAQRMAKVLCASSIVPQSYRDNLADCVIALEMANRIGANPLAVMQNLYIVHGRPAWSSQFLISCVNASGKFTPLRYRETGDKGADSWGCVAWAVDKSGERLESPEITIGMAKAEGWFSKNGSKWKTMPQLMLRYRAATLFARLFAPELTMGIQCDDEIIDVSPVVTDPVRAAKPVFSTTAPTPSFLAAPEDEKAEADAGLAPAVKEAPKEYKLEAPTPEGRTVNYLKGLRLFLASAKLTESDLLDHLRREAGVDASLCNLDEVLHAAPAALRVAYDNWRDVSAALLKKKGGAQ